MNERARIECVYRDEGPRMVRALLAYARSREIAEDSVAEAFAQVIRRGEDVHEVRAWVWRAAFRIARGEMAKKRHTAAPIEASYEMSDDAFAVFEALGKISPKQRAAIVLHHYADYSVRDVARMTDSTAPAVRVHLSVGRKRLRALLGDEDV
jgi:RNA polymerase sigma-70 factor, ECF subfamily